MEQSDTTLQSPNNKEMHYFFCVDLTDKTLDLTIFGLLPASTMVKGSGEGKGQEEESGGAEQGGYVGDIGKMGEGGRELLLRRGFDI